MKEKKKEKEKKRKKEKTFFDTWAPEITFKISK